MNDNGEVVFKGRLNNNMDEFIKLRNQLGDDQIQSVVEASRTWVVYDLLEKLQFNPKVANPLKTKAIAEAQIKTDSIDAQILSCLLKGDLIPEVKVAPYEVRRVKNIIRQRMWLVKFQTAMKNRIHHILDRNHISFGTGISDLFGVQGRKWMKTVSKELPKSEGELLNENLELLEGVELHVKNIKGLLREHLNMKREVEICKSLPGVGDVFGPLIALEIWDINRFSSESKLVAYAGLTPTTYSSGGKTFHGKLLPQSNKLLRYAFCEAAWAAIKSSPYFGSYYQRLRERLNPQKAIVGVARKMCEITWYCLQEQRVYEERVYKRWEGKEKSKVCQTR